MIKIIAKSRAYRPTNYFVAIPRTMTVSNCCLNLPLVIEFTYSSTQQYSFQVSYNTFAFSLTMSKIGKGVFEPPTHYSSSQLSYFPLVRNILILTVSILSAVTNARKPHSTPRELLKQNLYAFYKTTLYGYHTSWLPTHYPLPHEYRNHVHLLISTDKVFSQMTLARILSFALGGNTSILCLQGLCRMFSHIIIGLHFLQVQNPPNLWKFFSQHTASGFIRRTNQIFIWLVSTKSYKGSFFFWKIFGNYPPRLRVVFRMYLYFTTLSVICVDKTIVFVSIFSRVIIPSS